MCAARHIPELGPALFNEHHLFPKMEAAMVDSTSQTKTSTDLSDRILAFANDTDLIAVVLFSALGLLATIYFSMHFPTSDQIATLLSQAP